MRFARFSALALITGLLVAMLPVSNASAATSWSCFVSKRAERSFTAKMNQARSSRDLGTLTLDKQLSRVARKHSQKMAVENDVFHTNRTRLGQKVTRWYTLSENVGRGGTVASTHEAFMASEGHRANILYPSFKHVGVGTVNKNGIIYVSVVFEGSRDPGTTLSPPSC